jgi:hypothetical protein
MSWTKEELSKIRKNLPADKRQQLADKHNLKMGSLRNILSGLSNNEAVIISAIELANAHKEFIDSKKKLISSL